MRQRLDWGSGETHLADVVSDVDRGPRLHSGEPDSLILHRENSGDFPRSLDSGCCEQGQLTEQDWIVIVNEIDAQLSGLICQPN